VTFSALMVDVDGVIVVRPDGRRWDADMRDDLGLAPEDLQRAFFTPHWPDIVTGKARIEDRLPAALADVAPHLKSEDLIAYWFGKDAHLDEALLADLADVRSGGTPLHLATVQDHRRADYLWETLGLKERFDGLHHSAAVGFAKPDPAYFAEVARRVALPAGELMLIDDAIRNVEAARDAGWQARLWTGKVRLRDVLAP
jgi:putative hydrolase of the HAD superfamily